MTKKHYEAIAGIIKNRGIKCCGNLGVLAGLLATSQDLANYFEEDNKNFDRTRFLQACGIEYKGIKPE